jgi:hypothetical protein
MKWFLGLMAGVSMIGLGGCASGRVAGAPLEGVKRNGIAGIETFAREAREVAQKDYSRVASILGETNGAAFSIKFRKAIWIPYEGEGSGRTGGRDVRVGIGKRTFTSYRWRVIELSAERFLARPERLAKTVRHEMAHLFQAYPKGAPVFWVEGIAEFVAYELGGEATDCFCDAKFPHFTDGYGCAAAFLQFLRDRQGTNVVGRLHRAFLKGKSAEEFFATETGRAFGDLWKEFEGSHRYTADARAAVALREKVGASASEEEAFRLLMEFLRTLRGGELTASAIEHVKGLAERGAAARPEQWEVQLHPDELEQSDNFPARRVAHFDSKDRKRRYDYVLVKNAPDAEWMLENVLVRDLRNGRVTRRLK